MKNKERKLITSTEQYQQLIALRKRINEEGFITTVNGVKLKYEDTAGWNEELFLEGSDAEPSRKILKALAPVFHTLSNHLSKNGDWSQAEVSDIKICETGVLIYQDHSKSFIPLIKFLGVAYDDVKTYWRYAYSPNREKDNFRCIFMISERAD